MKLRLHQLEQAGATDGQGMVWSAALGMWVPGSVGLAKTTGTDTYTGSNPVVASGNNGTRVTGTGTLSPTTDCIAMLTATAKATNSGGTQGAYIWPELQGGPATAAPTVAPSSPSGVFASQVVGSPLNNTVVTGVAAYLLRGGANVANYRISYMLATGSGGPSVTFSSLKMTWTLWALN